MCICKYCNALHPTKWCLWIASSIQQNDAVAEEDKWMGDASRASQGQFGRKSLKDIPSKTRLHVWSRSESSVVNVKGEKALGEKTGQSQNILIWDIWPAIYFVRDNILPWDMVHWQFLFYLLAEQHLCKVILRTVCARPTTPWFIYPLPGCS